MSGTAPEGARDRCRRCRTELAPGLLRCPSCRTLVHADTLKQLAAAAERSERDGDHAGAAARWREALSLLPADAAQVPTILARAEAAARSLGPGPVEPRNGARGWWALPATLLLFVLGKLKFLLLGLTKLGTLASMLAFLGVYWVEFGWAFALGLVLSIYVHEMGHVAALRHYGIPASAPMFIPGFGALVRLRAHPPTPEIDARVGLAGPLWGLGAALAAWGLYLGTGNALYASIAHVGGLLNLFNLTPVWQLDGARGMAALSRRQRILLLSAVLLAFLVSHQGILVLVAVFVAWQCFRPAPAAGDLPGLVNFCGLLAALTWLIVVSSAAAPGSPI
ncbi:MAG: site-2 protease family protein [Gemmatimonadales bacterium]